MRLLNKVRKFFGLKLRIKPARPALKVFLSDWLDWTEGKPSKVTYSGNMGLCGSSTLFGYYEGIDLRDDLGRLFSECGLDRAYPFGYSGYLRDSQSYRMQDDPNRISWAWAALNDKLGSWKLQED